ncbi:MAG TPA: hypothetical protein VFX76_14340, partial [Roseiflexaceae bacterium]|nr:hypothetical protein [Roseiflexaceae bacterium]
PVERDQAKAMLERRHARQIVGGKADADSANAPVTAARLEEQERDPQLAAALKALIGRLQSGAYTKISQLSAAQIEQFLKRDEIEQRRASAAAALQKIDEELAQLGPGQPR